MGPNVVNQRPAKLASDLPSAVSLKRLPNMTGYSGVGACDVYVDALGCTILRRERRKKAGAERFPPPGDPAARFIAEPRRCMRRAERRKPPGEKQASARLPAPGGLRRS